MPNDPALKIIETCIASCQAAADQAKREGCIIEDKLFDAKIWGLRIALDAIKQKVDPLHKYADHERPGAVCYDCRREYGTFPDLLVSDEVWEKINPTHHRGCGLLCPTCMAVRVRAAGLDNIPAAFVSSPFVNGIVASKLGQGIQVMPVEQPSA